MTALIIAQEQSGDWIDVLLKIGIFATFVVFGVALLLIKLGKSKKPKARDKDLDP